jgi:glycosyltransferase involved in cell wall biosynthesis
MDVVGLVPARDHVSTRYRVTQFAEHLRAVGLNLRLEPLAQGTVARCRQLARPRRDSIVLLQRKLLPLWQLTLLRQSAPLLVYDFDDAVYLRDSYHPRGPYSLTRTLRFRATVQLADCVIAGNDYLADAAMQVTTPKKLHVIPTCVNAALYHPAEHSDHRPNRLVWIGSRSTLQSLETARPLLEGIGQAIPSTILRVICSKFPRFRHLCVEPADWSSETEQGDLRDCDIGISWVPDDRWSRGKCGLKILQYMAAGLPVIASPVGVHNSILGRGVGLLARTSEEWIAGIRQLVEDVRLRAELGREGRSQIEKRYHVDAWGPVLAERLAEVASR